MKPTKKNLPKFSTDWQDTNPKLHHLHFTWALVNLNKIDTAIVALSGYNVDMMNFIHSMYREREKLVKSDAAYFEAHNLLGDLGLLKRVGLKKLSI